MSDEFEKTIREALARAYTHKENETKEVDVVLLESMADEIMLIMDKELPETVVLAYESFTKGNTVADLLDNLIIREGRRR